MPVLLKVRWVSIFVVVYVISVDQISGLFAEYLAISNIKMCPIAFQICQSMLENFAKYKLHSFKVAKVFLSYAKVVIFHPNRSHCFCYLLLNIVCTPNVQQQ